MLVDVDGRSLSLPVVQSIVAIHDPGPVLWLGMISIEIQDLIRILSRVLGLSVEMCPNYQESQSVCVGGGELMCKFNIQDRIRFRSRLHSGVGG